MALIIYSWGNKLVKNQFTGVKPCPQCGRMTEQYTKRQFFTLGIFYIPIIWIPTKRYYVCESCGAGVEIDRAQYKEYKEKYRHMPKKSKYLAAYGQLEAIAPSLPDAERNAGNIYAKITETIKFTPEEEPFIRDMIKGYLDYAAAIASAQAAAAASAQAAAENAAQNADAAQNAGQTEGTAQAVTDGSAAPVVVENPTGAVPARSVPGSAASPLAAVQTAAGQTAASQPFVFSSADVQQPKKKKWGWLVAGIIQTFIMLFGLLMLAVGFDDLFTDGVGVGIFLIMLFGVIPVGLTVLFYYLFAKK